MADNNKYTDEQCAEMIRTCCYPVDAPDWVIQEIRKKRGMVERETKSPEKEMDDFMKGLGGSKRVG